MPSIDSVADAAISRYSGKELANEPAVFEVLGAALGLNRRGAEQARGGFPEETLRELASTVALLAREVPRLLAGRAVGEEWIEDAVVRRAYQLSQDAGGAREVRARLFGRNAEALERSVGAMGHALQTRSTEAVTDGLVEIVADTVEQIARHGAEGS